MIRRNCETADWFTGLEDLARCQANPTLDDLRAIDQPEYVPWGSGKKSRTSRDI